MKKVFATTLQTAITWETGDHGVTVTLIGDKELGFVNLRITSLLTEDLFYFFYGRKKFVFQF